MNEPQPRSRSAARADFTLGTLVVLVGLFVLVYRTLVAARLDRTVAMFVGVPMLLGTFAATRRARDPVVATMKYVTLCLCIVAPMLGEGAVCLAMAAPIVYPVAALTAWALTRSRSTSLRCAVALPFLLAVVERAPIDERPIVELADSAELDVPPDVAWRAIEQLALPLDAKPPLFLRLGFPTPRALLGTGVAPGAERRVVFANGTVVARVTESQPGRRFAVALSYADVGHEFFDRWLMLEDATFSFEPLPGGRTRLVHATHYRRLLAPAFYFGPLEEFGVHQMQRYLLDTFRRVLAHTEPRA
jgi:hypothetical protein